MARELAEFLRKALMRVKFREHEARERNLERGEPDSDRADGVQQDACAIGHEESA